MSLGEILNSALSGLGAAQASMRTVSNNIANVNTPGYAREKTSLTTDVAAGRVVGVTVGEPGRVADQFLEATVFARAGDAGTAEVRSTYLDRLQSFLGTSGAESGLPSRLDAIAASATAMTGASGGGQTNAAFIGDVGDTIRSIRQLGSDVSALRSDVEGEVGETVTRINSLLRQVHELNDTVSRAEGLGRSSAGAADQRNAVVEELGGLIGIVARQQSDGRLTIDTTAGVQLVDRRLRQLSYPSNGAGSSQALYQPIKLHFADAAGTTGAETGEKIDAAAGGKLGGLITLRDAELPAFTARLNTLYDGVARALNAASNAGTAVPAPNTLTGTTTPLVGSDRLGFTGVTSFSVTAADGTLVRQASIDFSDAAVMGPNPTVDTMVAKINAGLSGVARATFVDGQLKITADNTAQGIVVAQGTPPGTRGGAGFSQFFGLNDLVRSDGAMLTPAALSGDDPHGFTVGQATEFALRDTAGRLIGTHKLEITATTGGNFKALVADLNGGKLAAFGSFKLDSLGRIAFTAKPAAAGATLSVLSDTTDRGSTATMPGTGVGLAAITGLGGGTALASGQVRREIATDPGRLPLARLQTVAVGQKALGTGDRRGASNYADALGATVDLADGVTTMSRFANTLLGDTGTAAARAQDRTTEATARRDDAIARRDNYSGVSIDEELSQMVILQNSYSAAARVMSAASTMFDTLLQIGR